MFRRVERVGRCFGISYWRLFRRVVAYSQGSANKLFLGEECRHQNEKQKNERTIKAVFTFDKAMFMSGDLGRKKQHPWRLLREPCSFNLNSRGNIRSSAALSRGPRAGDATCVPPNCPGNRASLESKAEPSRSASQRLPGSGPTPLLAELSLLPARCVGI